MYNLIIMANLKILISKSNNPYINLAIESALLYQSDCPTLFLWKNERTVVIGANQNPYAECNTSKLLKDGGSLARRITGGGAVYHDTGNLNFSFIVDNSLYNVQKQLSVIQNSLKAFNIEAEIAGRNDLLAANKKFSGNAYYKTKKNCLHHGTILIKTDSAKLAEYLTVNPNKLQKKGVQSVKSRIINLSELNNDINSENIIPALINSFEKIYKSNAIELDFDTLASSDSVKELYDKYRAYYYLYGDWANFTANTIINNSWGLTEIALKINNNTIINAKISSDCLYPDLIKNAEKLLIDYKISDSLPDFSNYNIDEKNILTEIFEHINAKGVDND